jgi:putative MATE family efflux protein
MDPRTRLLLEAPIARTLLRLGAPNVLVMLSQAAVGLIETYFVGQLGTPQLAGMALVFPLIMFMQMTSNGAMGGGIASAVARALGGGRRDDAHALVLHAVLIALAFGAVFTLVMLLGGRAIYSLMGGQGEALEAALLYSNWVFAGAALIWFFNALSALIRGTGNMMMQALVMVGGAVVMIPLSAVLIFGWGPVPGFGIVGGALALLAYYALGSLVFVVYLKSRGSLLRLSWTGIALRQPLFWDILRVGLVGIFSTAATNIAIGFATAMVGRFGTAAIAGYGTASRLEYLLVPLVFGFGAPLVAMVGTCIGAGKRERALKATWIGAAMSFAMAECVGLWAALFPYTWLRLFDTDPAMLEAGAHYLRIVGPTYGFFGLGIVLYFASQGAGKLLWPVIGNIVRLAIALTGGWLAIQFWQSLTGVFAAQALALVVYGCLNAWAIRAGAWFGPVRWGGPAATLAK